MNNRYINMDTDGDKWHNTRKLWEKHPKLLSVGVYANLANKLNN